MSASTPCSSVDSDVAGRCELAPAGDATTHRPTAASRRAKRRAVRLPMPGRSAPPVRNPYPSNELPGFGDGLGSPVPQPVEEDDLEGAGDRDRRQRTEYAGELRADQH